MDLEAVVHAYTHGLTTSTDDTVIALASYLANVYIQSEALPERITLFVNVSGSNAFRPLGRPHAGVVEACRLVRREVGWRGTELDWGRTLDGWRNNSVVCDFRTLSDDAGATLMLVRTKYMEWALRHAGWQPREFHKNIKRFARALGWSDCFRSSEGTLRVMGLFRLAMYSKRYPHECKACQNVHGLRKCSKCQVVWYCDRVCQVRDWQDHKVPCRQITARAAAGEEPPWNLGDVPGETESLLALQAL